MSGDRTALARTLRLQGVGCRAIGSSFYGALLEHLAADAEAGGPTWALLGPHAQASFGAAYPLRLLGGVQRLALTGEAPALARHYPSTGGDGDVGAAWSELRVLLADPPAALVDMLARPPQTNEVGRAGALVGGFLVAARDSQLPLRVLELGASAGLNLRFDRYRYEQDEVGFGPIDSPVRLTGLWPERRPPFEAPLSVIERRGCDLDPIDPTTSDGALTLLSYVWPDQRDRLDRLRAALDIAARVDAPVDRADAPAWLESQLGAPRAGTATVVFHSIAWQYFSKPAQARLADVLAGAGAVATRDAPLLWLRLEPASSRAPYPELRVTAWPGPTERLLADCSFHLGPVHWKA